MFSKSIEGHGKLFTLNCYVEKKQVMKQCAHVYFKVIYA